MTAATNLGDPAATIGVAALMLLSFLLVSRQSALRWLVAVALCGLLIGSAKIGLYVQARPVQGIWVASPSGHTAGVALVYGALCREAVDARHRRSALFVGVGLVAFIAFTRIYLGLHTPGDVAAGFIVGAGCLLWFSSGGATARAQGLARWCTLGSLTVCCTTVALGWQLRIDRLLRLIAAYVVRPLLKSI